MQLVTAHFNAYMSAERGSIGIANYQRACNKTLSIDNLTTPERQLRDDRSPFQLLASGYPLSRNARQRFVVDWRFDGQRSDARCANHEETQGVASMKKIV